MSFKHLTRVAPLTLSTKHLQRLRKHCAINGLSFEEDKFSEIYSFWFENVCVPTHYDRVQRPAAQASSINKVLFDTAPDLMFVNLEAMRERMSKFSQLGFINNVDKLFLFCTSPYGWFLQDWEHFSTKFSYIQFRIMPWLLAKEDDQYPEPHPLIRTCEALELPYEQIKARYLWVSSAGIAPSKLNDEGGDDLDLCKVLRNLLLTDPNYFVKVTTPGAKLNEYKFFEKMVGQHELLEDSIMSQLSELDPKVSSEILHNHENEDIREAAKAEHRRLK